MQLCAQKPWECKAEPIEEKKCSWAGWRNEEEDRIVIVEIEDKWEENRGVVVVELGVEIITKIDKNESQHEIVPSPDYLAS